MKKYSLIAFLGCLLTVGGVYGQWVLSGGYQGTALTCDYDGKTNGPYKNTIDHTTWGRIDIE